MTCVLKQQSSTDVAASGCGAGRSIPPPGADRRCFYCNAFLKCGQQCCIWREERLTPQTWQAYADLHKIQWPGRPI